MKYTQYITKRRMRVVGIGGAVNIPWGTVLPVEGDFIQHNGKALCGVRSRTAQQFFYGYDPSNPEAEIKRQQAVEALLATSPKEDGDALALPWNPWNKYGHLAETPGMCVWEWDPAVEDLPQAAAEYLLTCIKSGAKPWEVPEI